MNHSTTRPVSSVLALAALLLAVVTAPTAARADDAEAAAVLEAFRSYNNAMMALKPEEMSKLQHAVTDEEKSVSAAAVETDLAVARLKLAALEAYGDGADRKIGQAVGDISNDDLHLAKVTVTGERAVVSFAAEAPAGGGGSLPMIKVNGQWKFDMTQPAAVQPQLAAAAERYLQRAKATDQVTAAIKASKFETLDEAIAEIRRSL